MTTNVIFMCGTGGVGKTTSSVAMAMSQARKGKRCVLLTIDPAQRLADALHLQMTGNVASQVPLPDEAQGELWAMMLDAGAAFEDFCQQHSTPDTWRNLSTNRYFHFARGKMGGIQEMMAVMKMMELVTQYDVVIVDTPPAQNARQFFDAPEKIQHLFAQSALQWLTSKSSGFSSVSFAKSLIAKGLNFFLGSETMTEISDFFGLFQQAAEALEQIAHRCQELLIADTTKYWLIDIPNRRLKQLDALETALTKKRIQITGRLLNKAPIPLSPVPDAIEDPAYVRCCRPSTNSNLRFPQN